MDIPLFRQLTHTLGIPTSSDPAEIVAMPGLGEMCTKRFIDGDTQQIATYCTTTAEPEATVVFIHGFTLAADSFFLQVRYLRDNFPRVRCLLLDLRGHGQTGEADPTTCTVDGAADDVMAAIAAEAPTGPLIIVGHSLGGHIALSTIRRCPDEIYQRITGVILIATSIESLSSQGLPQVLASPIADRAYKILESSPEKIEKFRNEVSDVLAPALAATVFKRRKTPYDLVRFHAQMIQQTPLATFAGYFDDLQKHEELNAAPRLAGLPGFVIVGDDDRYTPLSQSTSIIQHWPDAQLVETKGVGHMIILEAPELVNEALAELLDG